MEIGDIGMDNVKECFERIRIIRGVNYGLITKDQIKDAFISFSLTEEEQESLWNMLEENEIVPMEEDDYIESAKKSGKYYKDQGEDLQQYDEEFEDISEEERYNQRKEKLYLAFECSLEEEPTLMESYSYVLPLLKKSISEGGRELLERGTKLPPNYIMAYSVIGHKTECIKIQPEETYLNKQRDCFKKWIGYYFSENEISQILSKCMNDENLTEEETQKLTVIYHNAPRVGKKRV